MGEIDREGDSASYLSSKQQEHGTSGLPIRIIDEESLREGSSVDRIEVIDGLAVVPELGRLGGRRGRSARAEVVLELATQQMLAASVQRTEESIGTSRNTERRYGDHEGQSREQ